MRPPEFFIVGAMKAGTTSLASWLREHPEVFVPAEKELHFFTTNWGAGLEWYAQKFAEGEELPVRGEATPTYLIDEQALRRMRDLAPGAKLIVMAREPVERAYSHYKHWHRKGEPRPFGEACAEELALGRPPAEPHWDPAHPERYRYLAPGRYARQLDTLAALFPREHIHVVFTEELEADPAGTYAAVCEFLGVDAGVRPPAVGSRENVAVVLEPLWLYRILLKTRFGKWAPPRLAAWVFKRMARPDTLSRPLTASLRAALREHFAEDNAALAEWLGRRPPASWSLPADQAPPASALARSGA